MTIELLNSTNCFQRQERTKNRLHAEQLVKIADEMAKVEKV